MIEYIKDGIIWGVGLSLLTGPILFAIIDQSLRNGKRAGISLAAGVWVSDILFSVICFFVYDSFDSFVTRETILKLFGPLSVGILIVLGIVQVISAYKDRFTTPTTFIRPGIKREAWLKGFSLNIFNPFSIFFWMAMIIYFSTKVHADRLHFLIFASCMLLTIMILDIAKVFGAGSLRQKLRPENLYIIKMITGILFIISAIVVAVRIFGELV